MESIGKYEVLGKLGEGGMGMVYLARDPVIGRDVAIKVIQEKSLDNPDVKRRFYREARSAGRLSHENVVTIHDVDEDNGNPYLVMELLDGVDLRKVIDEGRVFSLDRKLDIATQICRGLGYAHENRVIHRDVKPGNIQILENGRVKLLDFGIARLESETSNLTHSSIGTPRYMAPEQIRGEEVDQRIDIFSFGVVFYELVSGANPFTGERVTEVMYKVLNLEPEPLDLQNSPLTEDIRRFAAKCIAKNRDERYATFTEVIRDLETLRGKVGVDRSPPDPRLEGDPSEMTRQALPTLPEIERAIDPPVEKRTAATEDLTPRSQVHEPSRPGIGRPVMLGAGLVALVGIVSFVVWIGGRSSDESTGPEQTTPIVEVADATGGAGTEASPPDDSTLRAAVLTAKRAALAIRSQITDPDDELIQEELAEAESLLERAANAESDQRFTEAAAAFEDAASRYRSIVQILENRPEVDPEASKEKLLAENLKSAVASSRNNIESEAKSPCVQSAHDAGAQKESDGMTLFASGEYERAATAFEEARRAFDRIPKLAADHVAAEDARSQMELEARRVEARRAAAEYASEFGKADGLRDQARRELGRCRLEDASSSFRLAAAQYRFIGSLPDPGSEPSREQSPKEVVDAATSDLFDKLKTAMREGDWDGIQDPIASTYEKYHKDLTRKNEVVEVLVDPRYVDTESSPVVMVVNMVVKYRQQGSDRSQDLMISTTWEWEVEGGTAAVTKIEAR